MPPARRVAPPGRTHPATMPPPVSRPTASFAAQGSVSSRDGTRIHHYTVGEGAPALVCCDGLGCDGYVWK